MTIQSTKKFGGCVADVRNKWCFACWYVLVEFREMLNDYRRISNDCFLVGTIYRFQVEGMLVEQVEHQYLNAIWKFGHSTSRCQGLVLLVVNLYTLDDVVLFEAALKNDHYLNEYSFFLTPLIISRDDIIESYRRQELSIPTCTNWVYDSEDWLSKYKTRTG